jgi:Flp pilus assembly protein TadG
MLYRLFSKKASLPSFAAARRLKTFRGRGFNRAVSLKDRFRRLRKRMRADSRKGSAAIEFAFVAPVFFVLLMGIFESAIMFFSQSILQSAVSTVGRTLRTGQAGTAMTANDFRTKACAQPGMSLLLSGCDSNSGLVVSSQVFAGGFGGAAGGAVTGTGTGFSGGACDVMLLRATYAWTVVTPGLTVFLVNAAGGKHLLVSTLAFRNEPYGGAPC